MIKLIQKGIDTCTEKSVGPPVKIMVINKNNTVKEINRFPYQQWNGVTDYYQGILDKKIKIIYLYKWGQDSLEQKICEWKEFESNRQ